MGLYEYVSGISVLIYIFIFLIILNSKQSKIRDIFLRLIMISIIWTGGSLLMRKQAFPTYVLWYHVSLMGILFMPIMYFRFIMEYIHNVKRLYIHIYSIFMCGAFVVNVLTGLFIPPPVIEVIDGITTMVYESVEWPVYILYTIGVFMVVQMLWWFYTGIRHNPKLRRLSRPITIGIIVMVAGNLLFLIPIFGSFPIDILSGLINSLALLYALTKKSPFRLKMLVSESIGYAICLFLAFLSLYILNPVIESILTKITLASDSRIVWYLALFSLLLVGYFSIWKMVVVGIFVKDEEEKSELLNLFSANITKSLDSEHIFRQTISIIEQVVGSYNVYVALKTSKNALTLSYSNQALADLSVSFRSDNPLIKRLSKQNSAIIISEFHFDTSYQTMWEQEKYDLVKLDITHAFGLIDDAEIHGVLLMSDAHSKKKLRHQQILKLQSICTIVSIALKNAASYEQAVVESRTDDLTGLYNRKYFYQLIEKKFIEQKNDSLALVMLNLDDFKLYNQLYGVKKADQALEVIATILKGSVGKDRYVARFSGKEFAIILPGYDVHRTLKLVEKANQQIFECTQSKVKRLEKHITTSVGICVYPYGASNVNELIENVQQAVYQVKRNGKNAVRVFDTFVQKDELSEKRSYSSIYNEYKSTIYALTAAIDAKDHYTFSHSDNVANYAVAFAKELNLNNDIVENIRQAALLHDIGKISIPEPVLNKPGRLSDEEFKLIQGHVDASIDIIRHLPSLDYVIPAVLGHHERYDGTGYPRRTKGEDIPLTARILCLADSFDAMVSDRVYKDPKPLHKVIEIIEEEAGKQFDPKLAIIFVDMLKSGKIRVDQPTIVSTPEVKTYQKVVAQ
ncbi:diguanylate cyclase [Mycoplasmatota bacterium zrk1]